MLLVILFATISFHAFFGVALTGSETLLAPDFFGQINLPWGPDPLLDQERAGEIAWGFGEAPTLFLAVVVAFQWFKRDEQRPGARTARPTATATPSSRPTTSTSGACATRPTTSTDPRIPELGARTAARATTQPPTREECRSCASR